ncbi:MAG: amidohydrolase family protein [Methylocystis sp.]
MTNVCRSLADQVRRKFSSSQIFLRHIAVLALFCQSSASIGTEIQVPSQPNSEPSDATAILLTARRVFDGVDFRSDQSVLIKGAAIVELGPRERLKDRATEVIDLGDATILPGFIELHAHIAIHRIPDDVVLKHGVTTLREVGGPLLRASGGIGKLRHLTSGPIITVQGGYPISIFGKGYVAEAVQSVEEARALVRRLVQGGAAVIKIALEPGGEPGAPWSQQHPGIVPPPWAMAKVELVSTIVAEAHRLGKIVTAHIGESRGASIALDAGVDEWAHVPCSKLDDRLIERAALQKVKVVTTLDTMSHCSGVFANARKLSEAGVSFLYGAEIAHLDVPWGIDAQELQLMRHAARMSDVEILRAATSEAGRELGMEPLGKLTAGAPADLIAVKGDPQGNFKILEYPDLVISGGTVVLNNFR